MAPAATDPARAGLGGTVRGRLVGVMTVRAMRVSAAAALPGVMGRPRGNDDHGNPVPTTIGQDHGTTGRPTAPRPIANGSIVADRRTPGRSSVAPAARRARGTSTVRLPAAGIRPTVIVARTLAAAANARRVGRDRR